MRTTQRARRAGLAALAASGAPVIASGGVGGSEDVKALAPLGLLGVIAGKAIYEGRLDVAATIEWLAAS